MPMPNLHTPPTDSFPKLRASDAIPEQICEGSLESYLKKQIHLAIESKNKSEYTHMCGIFVFVIEACRFYSFMQKGLSPREVRNLLIAAIFCDFEHSGSISNDELEIAHAIDGFRKNIESEDENHREAIERLIRATQYPYQIPNLRLPLSAQIIRDADLCRCLNKEKLPAHLTFATAWAQAWH